MNTIHIIVYSMYFNKTLLIALHVIAGIYIHMQPGTWGQVVKQRRWNLGAKPKRTDHEYDYPDS